MKSPCCQHCRKPFLPEIHNAWHQRYCTNPECQRARNRESCRNWRLKNPTHFKGYDQRVRDWRHLHPRYWRQERRKALTAEILLPVYRAGRVGLRIRDRIGTTLQHVVIAKTCDWRAVCRGVGTTLQNVVHGLRGWTYRGWHERTKPHAAAATGKGQPPA